MELLVVIAVMAILLVISLPAFTSINRSSSLTTTVQGIVDQLNLARQTALSRNASVEVRFYRLPDYHQPPASSAPSVYRAMQIFIYEDGRATPLARPQYFKPVMLASDNTTVSSLLDNTTTAETAPPTDAPNLGEFQQNYRYRSFRFRPNGSTSLPDNVSIHLSLKNQNDPIVANDLPANFATIQIDPVTGRVRTFRP